MKTKMDEIRKNMLRSARNVLVDLFVTLARTVFFWLPGGDPAYGHALMVLHPFLVAIFLGAFFLLPPRSPGRLLIAFISYIAICSQWLLGGCVITRAEQQLTGKKITIVDPWLTLANIPANRDTRNAATIISGVVVGAVITWVLFCDFIRGVPS